MSTMNSTPPPRKSGTMRALPATALAVLALAALLFLPSTAEAQQQASAPPAAPTGLTATAGDGSVTLAWDDPADASITGYEYRVNHNDTSTGRFSGWGEWQAIADSGAGATSHTVTGLTNGTEQRFKLRAVNAHGASGAAPAADPWFVTATPTPTPEPTPEPTPQPPATVASVAVTRADGSLTASWDAVSGATKHHVTYTSDNGASWSLAAIAHPSSSITFDVDNTNTYVVGVRTGNDGGWSAVWVNSPASGPYTPPPPAAPAGLSAAAGDGSVTLSWDDPGDSSITGYEYRLNHNDTSTGNLSGWSAWQGIAGSAASTTSHTFTGLTNGTEQRFKLRAVNAAGNSGVAPAADPWFVSATPAGAPALTVESVTATSATLSVANHDGAWYYRASGGNGGGAGVSGAGASANSGDPPDDCIGPINGQANMSRLGSNTTYNVTVYGGQCQGGAMASGSFSTLSSDLADPTGVTVHRGYDATQPADARGTMDVSWGAVPNATGYKVAYTRNWHDFSGEVTVSGGDTTTAAITGFDHSKYYWVVVKATGANNAESGWGWSAISYAAVPPRPVYKMTLMRVDAGLQVSWKQCDVTGDWCNSLSPVTGFRIDLSGDGGTTWTKVWEAASVTVTNYATEPGTDIVTGDASATVCGADDDKTYRVRIGVTNRMGTAWSEASVASSTVGPRTTAPTPGARNPCQDFDTLSAAGNRSARGIGSDGATMWVVDSEDSKIYAYDMATKARDTSKEISLDSAQDWVGIATDGVTLWASNNDSADTIYAYNPDTGARNTAKDLTMSGTNDQAYQVWNDGGHLWVHDQGRKKIYAYDLTDNNAQDISKTISLENKNGYRGIWSDGATMWIMENSDAKAYAYNLASRARDSAKDYSTLDGLPNLTGYGVWSDGTTLWIADQNAGKLYAYHSISPVATPAAPTTVNAYRGNGFVDAEWPAVTGATGYNVEHYHPWNVFFQGREWVRVATNTSATSIRVPRSNWAGDVIRVQAVKRLNTLELASGWTHSDPVPQVTTYPVAPSGLAASRISAGEIVVGWTQCDVTQSSCSSGTPVTFHVDVSSNGGASWSRSKTLTSYTSGAAVSVTQGVTSSVDRVRVTVDTRVKDASAAVSVATVSLTASSVTSSGATLTLSGHTGGWWHEGGKMGGTLGACTSVPSGNSVALTGLDSSDWYDYKAYSGADCGAADLIATERFSTKTPGSGIAFTATSVAWNAARLTLSGHTGSWWYKGFERGGDEGSCTAGPSDFVLDLLGLSGNAAYTYRAYSDSGCGTQIASSTFRTQAAPSLTASSITASGATLTLTNHAGDWWYDGGARADVADSCRKGGADYSVDLTGLHARTSHTYSAYADNGCAAASQLDTVSFTTLAGLTVSEVTATGATLTISGYTGQWWYRADTGPDATCQGPVAAGTATKTLTGLTGLTAYVYSAYSTSACRTANLLATASSFTTLLNPTLTASNVAATTATLTIATHGGGAWYYKHTNAGATCDGPVAAGTSTKDLTGLTAGTSYTYSAYSDSTCTTANLIATASQFTTLASLTASSITVTGATLTIAGHSGNWYYKHTNTGATCEGPVSGLTKAVTGLDAGTSYTYSAYSDNTCTTGNLLATASQFTTLSSVSNLGSTKSGSGSGISNDKQAVAFTVGSNSGGYALKSVTVPLKKNSSRSGKTITVTLHAMQGSGQYSTFSQASATVLATLTLSGTLPTDRNAYTNTTFTCSGSGCDLAAGKTYFVVAVGNDGSRDNWVWATPLRRPKPRSRPTTAGTSDTVTTTPTVDLAGVPGATTTSRKSSSRPSRPRVPLPSFLRKQESIGTPSPF